MGGLAKTHGFLETGGRVHVAAIGRPVTGVDGVVDAAAGFLAAIGDGELAGGSPDGLCSALFEAGLVNRGGAAGKQRHNAVQEKDVSKGHEGLLQGLRMRDRNKCQMHISG